MDLDKMKGILIILIGIAAIGLIGNLYYTDLKDSKYLDNAKDELRDITSDADDFDSAQNIAQLNIVYAKDKKDFDKFITKIDNKETVSKSADKEIEDIVKKAEKEQLKYSKKYHATAERLFRNKDAKYTQNDYNMVIYNLNEAGITTTSLENYDLQK